MLALSFTVGCVSGKKKRKEEEMFDDDSNMQGIAKFSEHLSLSQLTIV